MTLEDFFTLAEMRDGISNLARVEELLLVIQNLKDPDTSDGVDALRQWSTVASTLMTTKNEECLNQFLSLNGHSFLNKWLQKVLNLSEDTDGIIVEELINSLLGSFEKLPIDIERANTSGILITIKHLLDHKCVEIKDKARILYDKWNIKADDIDGENDLVVPDDACQREEVRTFEDAQVVDISECIKADKESCERQNVGMESRDLDETRCLDNSQPDFEKNEVLSISNQFLPSTSSNAINSTVLREANSSGSSLVLNCKQESSSVIEETSATAAYALDVTCISHCIMKGVGDGKPEESLSKYVTDVMKQEEDLIPYKSNQKDIHSSFSSVLSVPESLMAVVSPTISCDLGSKGTESCLPKTVEPQGKHEVNYHMGKCSTTTEESKSVVHATEGTKDILGLGKISSTDGSQSYNHKIEAVKTDGATKEFPYQADLKRVVNGDVMCTGSLKMSEGKSIKAISQKSEFGIIDDALEVARQVAIAVEREVVDYREPFCSSPDVDPMEAGFDCSPDSEDDEHDQAASRQVSLNTSPSGSEDHSGSDSSTKEQSEVTQNVNSDFEKSDQSLESSKGKTLIQESVDKSKRVKIDLDLNADFHTEELESFMNPLPDISVNVSAPVAITASSKGAPVLSFIPLHFEGELGWKGSVATSAFRPASPRRTPEGGKTQSGSRQNCNFLEIDLNIADCETDVVVEPILLKKLPASAGLPSVDSSMEASSVKTERLKLDLNRLDDDDVPIYASPYFKINHQNVDQSLSSASSSSARQPPLSDFDLNDNPTSIDIDGSHYFDISSSKTFNRYGLSKLDDPVITLMDSTMPSERKDFSNQSQLSFQSNRLNLEHAAGSRPMMPCVQMPPGIYSYTGFPNRPGVSVPQPFCAVSGSIPYMGSGSVFPQVNASGAFNGVPSARPPFLVNVSDAPSRSACLEVLRPGLDLNSGTTSVDTGNQCGNLKQFFWQGHGGLVDAQAKGTQPSSSGISLKRKEPECGLDSYPFGYKHMTSWQ